MENSMENIYTDLYSKLSYARILIGSHLWFGGQEDRCVDDVIIKTF